ILNAPTRGIGDTTVERIDQHAQAIGFKFHVAARKWRHAGIQEKIGENIDSFFKLLDQLPHDILYADPSKSVGDALLSKLREIGYRDYLGQTAKDRAIVDKKWQILEIFSRVLDSFVERGGRSEKTVHEFIDAMELRDMGQNEEEEQADKVQLLTLHACKGLEFPVVLFVGCEEDLLPHRTLGSDVSEERRLFYVGITRAKDRLVMTRAKTRKRFGKFQLVAPSRFLLEIPESMVSSFDPGFRPATAEQRKSLLSDLFKKLEATAPSQKIER
ncbi:MAG: 3'-5' exonuclease, partial [Bdellovibrionota bacterium]